MTDLLALKSPRANTDSLPGTLSHRNAIGSRCAMRTGSAGGGGADGAFQNHVGRIGHVPATDRRPCLQRSMSHRMRVQRTCSQRSLSAGGAPLVRPSQVRTLGGRELGVPCANKHTVQRATRCARAQHDVCAAPSVKRSAPPAAFSSGAENGPRRVKYLPHHTRHDTCHAPHDTTRG